MCLQNKYSLMDADKLMSPINLSLWWPLCLTWFIICSCTRILRRLARSHQPGHGVRALYDSVKWFTPLIYLNRFYDVSSVSSTSELQLIRIRGRKKWQHTCGIRAVQRKRLLLRYFCPAKPFSSFTCACVAQAVRVRCVPGEHAHLWKACVCTHSMIPFPNGLCLIARICAWAAPASQQHNWDLQGKAEDR